MTNISLEAIVLILIESEEEKRRCQERLQRSIKKSLKSQGKRKAGYQSGQVETTFYSNGEGQLWFAVKELNNHDVPRFWNAFGIFDSEYSNQNISVEINIPTKPQLWVIR